MPQESREIILHAAAHGDFLKTWVKGLDRQHPPTLCMVADSNSACVDDLSPYSALIQSFWGWCFKRQEWVWQKFLLSLLVVVVRISMSCFAGTQERVTLFTQAWAIGKHQSRDYSKIHIFLVHIVGYWVQSCLTLPEMSEKFPFLIQNIKCEQKQFCWL